MKIPDLTAQMQKLQDGSEESERQRRDACSSWAIFKRKSANSSSALGETGWEAENQWTTLGRQAGELGRQMGEIGRQIGELARQQVEKNREAAEQMRHLLDDAIANGIAKPE